MAIRITDAILPGYERVPLGEVGKTPPPGVGTVGTQVMNQAQARLRNAQSLASAVAPVYTLGSPTSLTSNTSQPPFVVSARSQLSSFAPYKAFDTTSTCWAAGEAPPSVGNPSWLQLDCGTPLTYAKLWVQPYASMWRPTQFTVQGSNDAATWDDLLVVSSVVWDDTNGNSWVFTRTGAYRYYRVLITGADGARAAIGKLAFYTVS
jgi:hypothetical protein